MYLQTLIWALLYRTMLITRRFKSILLSTARL